jgi:hypothetical protein
MEMVVGNEHVKSGQEKEESEEWRRCVSEREGKVKGERVNR